MRGTINSADRIQRLIAGSLLLVLNLLGIQESQDWTPWFALVVQLELLATGLAGWCPVYWSLGRRGAP